MSSNPYARKYTRHNPAVEHYTRTHRVGGPNTRQQARVEGRPLDYGLMPVGYATGQKKFARATKAYNEAMAAWMKAHGHDGRNGGTRRRGKKARLTRRR